MISINAKCEAGAKGFKRSSNEAAGYDIYSFQDIEIPVNERKMIRTGVSLSITKGYYGQIKSRSGLSAKHNIDAMAGVIDSDYRGEIKVILHNYGNKVFKVQKYDRIAQIVFLKHEIPYLKIVNELDDTERQEGGFGSTGL
jgi:dUTP pyrophosphatase